MRRFCTDIVHKLPHRGCVCVTGGCPGWGGNDRSIGGVEASMDADLDALATKLQVRTDDFTWERRWLRHAREDN